MPTHQGISIELHSQFDIDTIPEYGAFEKTHYEHRDLDGKPPLIIDGPPPFPRCSVYIPSLPGSQFWINYTIPEPDPNTQWYVFKLFIEDAEIMTWSCGKSDDWKGKAMFGLFETTDEDGKKRAEKRALFFSGSSKQDENWLDISDPCEGKAHMDIRVYRSHGRRRIPRRCVDYRETPHAQGCENGITLVPAGPAGATHPKRLYDFALIDPRDKPFVSFRYYYRTWEQLRALEILEEDSETSVNENLPTSLKCDDMQVPEAWGTVAGFNAAKVEEQIRKKDQGRKSHRLSIPPSLRLAPPEPSLRPAPLVPQKHNPQGPLEYSAHPAYDSDDEYDVWGLPRTPSPVRSTREDISSPSPGSRRELVATSLVNTVTNMWKRRGTPSSEHSKDGGSRSAFAP